MKCHNPICLQPIVVRRGNVLWCAARHRREMTEFEAILDRLNEQFRTAQGSMFRALLPTFVRAAEAFREFGEAIAGARL